jgi:hypothetical protein
MSAGQGVTLGTYAKLDGSILIRMVINDGQKEISFEWKPDDAAHLARAILDKVNAVPKLKRG